MSEVDAEASEGVLLQREEWMLEHDSREADPLVAIDGKARCGSAPPVEVEQKSRLVSALSLPSGRVLGALAIESRTLALPRLL